MQDLGYLPRASNNPENVLAGIILTSRALRAILLIHDASVNYLVRAKNEK
jgi:hypothetical protein